MIEQIEFTLRPHARGIHLVTGDVLRKLPPLPEKGLLNLLIKHTSAALALNENADPDVRHDLALIFDRNFIMTIIGSAAIVVILWLWLPMMSPIISFLPLYSIYLIVRGVKYLRIPTNRTNAMIMMFAALCIGLPLLLYTLFSALLPE